VFTVFKDEVFPDKSLQSSRDETSVVAPQVESIGTIDSGAEITAKKFSVPDFKGKYYAEIIENKEYETFAFNISDKAYSDDFPKGTIISQSVAPKSEVVRDTKIEFVISLGSKEIKMPSLIGMNKDQAVLELLKNGFMYEFINSDKEKEYVKYDEDSDPGVVLDQYPEYGTKVTTDIAVEFYINSYTGDEETESTLEETSSQE
jgi:beta-lactam-binding protein with PASTA domain